MLSNGISQFLIQIFTQFGKAKFWMESYNLEPSLLWTL